MKPTPRQFKFPSLENPVDVIVDRERWGRGTGIGTLLDPETGKMCCLGFACLAFGFTPEEIERKGMPSSLADVPAPDVPTKSDPEKVIPLICAKSKHTGRAYDTSLAGLLAASNDRGNLSDSEREALIKGIGLQVGINFSFR